MTEAEEEISLCLEPVPLRESHRRTGDRPRGDRERQHATLTGARGARTVPRDFVLSMLVAMFLANLNYTIEARWAQVVANAMRTFTIAEDPAQAELRAEVENLRQQLGRKGLRKKKGGKGDAAGA